MLLGFGPRYQLHLFLDYKYTLISLPILKKSFLLLYKDLSALYSLPCYILVFHFEGLGLFPLILVPSGFHWKASTPSYELWRHCSGVISSLMQPAKWVQSIECGGDECFFCPLPFFACRQIFLLFLDLWRWTSEFVLGPSKDTKISSGSLGIVVSLCLQWVVYINPKGLLSVPSEVCFSDIGLLSSELILKFSSSHSVHS